MGALRDAGHWFLRWLSSEVLYHKHFDFSPQIQPSASHSHPFPPSRHIPTKKAQSHLVLI